MTALRTHISPSSAKEQKSESNSSGAIPPPADDISLENPMNRLSSLTHSAVVGHAQPGGSSLRKRYAPRIGEIASNTQAIGHLGLTDKAIDDLLGRCGGAGFKLGGADLADRGGGVGPADVDAARGAGEGAVGAVDVDVLAARGGDQAGTGGEVGLELAAVGAGGDGEFDEHVVLVGGAVVLADGEAREVGFNRLGLGDAGVVGVDGCACSALF
jgi:hypothetical protein